MADPVDGEQGNGSEFDAQQAIMQMQMQELFDACPTKTVVSGVAGFGIGIAWGVLMGSFDHNIHTEEFLQLSTKEQMRRTLKDMGTRSYSSAKNFGLIGAIFAGSECVVESFRAKHDIYNVMISGCFTGGVLGSRAGPQAMVSGCIGFAAFSAAIEKLMNSEHSPFR